MRTTAECQHLLDGICTTSRVWVSKRTVRRLSHGKSAGNGRSVGMHGNEGPASTVSEVGAYQQRCSRQTRRPTAFGTKQCVRTVYNDTESGLGEWVGHWLMLTGAASPIKINTTLNSKPKGGVESGVGSLYQTSGGWGFLPIAPPCSVQCVLWCEDAI